LSEGRPSLRLPADLPADIAELALQGTEEALQRLVAIGTEPNKKRAKAARRALFILRQHGVHMPEPARNEEATSAMTESGKSDRYPAAFLTMSDSEGTRYALYAPGPRNAPTSIVEFGGDWRIVSCAPRAASLETIEADHRSRRPDREPGFAPISVDYLRYLMESGAKRLSQLGELLPPGYSAIHRSLPSARRTEFAECPVYEVIPAHTVANDPLKQYLPARLLAEYPLSDSAVDGEALKEWAGRALETDRSPLVLTEAQQRERAERFLQRATDALITPERAEWLIRRLEHDALVLWHTGRPELARMLLHHAVVGRRAGVPSRWPLAVMLVTWFIGKLTREERGSHDAQANEDSGRPRIIVPPR